MTRFRWVIVTLLFLATTINYIDRQILALLKPMLDQELGWTNQQYGLVNSAFQAAYAASYLAFGWLIDGVGIKIGYALSITMWSLAAAGHGLVGSIRGFLVARLALGTGEGGSFPASIKAVAYWFPPRERALAASLFNSGANVGPILAPVAVPWIAATWGWRAAFLLAGLAGLAWLALWLPLYDPPEDSPRVSPAELAHIRQGNDVAAAAVPGLEWRALFGYRETWAYILTKFLTDPISWFWLIWLPDYFHKTRGFDIKASWPHLVTIYGLSLLLSVSGGWLSGRLISKGWGVSRARKTTLFLFAVCVVPVLFAPYITVWAAVALIGLALAAHHAWATTFYAVVSDVFPKRSVAAIAGIGGMSGSLGGMLFPVFCGWVLDWSQHRPGGETAGYAFLFALCSGAYLLAFVVNHLLSPTFEPLGAR